MFFGFTEEEKMLQRSVRDMFKDRNTTEDVRKFMDNPTVSPAMQKLLGQQGLLGIIDLEGNEDGKGIVNGILIAQEAGRSLLTYPLIEAMVGTAALNSCSGQSKLASEVEEGNKLLTVAWAGEAQARKVGDSFILNGTLREIPFAQDADVILANVRVNGGGFTAEEEETLVVIDAKNPAVSIRNANSVDETYPLYELTASDYAIRPEDVVKGVGMGTGNALMSKMRQIASLLLAAELVGSSEKAMYETVEYTKQRKQFGVVIGSFQAMKHMAAEMFTKVESAKVAVEYAAWAVDSDDEEADIAVSIAKSYASQMGIKVGGDAIQMHGGIGFTWENDMHLYFKRARRSAALLGDAYTHRENIAKVAVDHAKEQWEKLTKAQELETV